MHQVRSPRTNGFVERMNRTLLDECVRVKGRTEWDLSPAEIQRDLDAYLGQYRPPGNGGHHTRLRCENRN